MNFAPYQDSSPESTRAPVTPSPATFPLPSPDTFENEPHHAGPSSSNTDTGTGFGTGSSTGFGTQRQSIDAYATSLPLRLDILACLAYVALPPAGGALLLLLERRSDYVRFHAWQGSLVFGFLFVSFKMCVLCCDWKANAVKVGAFDR